MGEVKRIEPPQSVPSQLKVLIADGTAITMVVIMNAVPSNGFMPLTNIWWPQTIHDKKAIAIIENAIEPDLVEALASYGVELREKLAAMPAKQRRGSKVQGPTALRFR